MSASKATEASIGKIASMDSSDIKVVAQTHPFKIGERFNGYVKEGYTLEQILQTVQPDKRLNKYAVIFINDRLIPEKFYSRITPKSKAVITIRIVPHGGGGDGGKNPLRIILTIAVIAVAFAFAPALGGLFLASGAGPTATAFATGIAGGVISGVGMLLVNALAPIRPPTMGALSATSAEDSPTLFISGARNQARPFSVIPVVLGKHKQVPPYGALPYTEIVANNQYLRLVLVWGYGPLKIENIRIGDTPIGNFTDVEIYHRQGFQDDPALQIFTQDVFEENLQIALTQSAGNVTRFTTSETDEVSVDFVLSRGLVTFDNQGNKTNRTVELQVEYKEAGGATWHGDTVAVSASDSPTLPAEPGTKQVLINDVDTAVDADTPHRIDVVCIDKVTGAQSIVVGTTAFGVETAIVPSVPSTVWPIAQVARAEVTNIVNADITDVRTGSEPFGAGDFIPTEDSPQADNITLGSGTITTPLKITITERTTSSVRRTLRFAVPTRQQYEIRARRITADTTNTSIADDITWVVLRSFTKEQAFNATGLATTELRIKASDQLNNVIDQLSGDVTSILPDYDSVSGDWIVRETQNPASLFRAVLQGPANKRPIPDSRIDIANLESWHTKNIANSTQFNMIRDYNSSVWNTLVDVAGVAFASPSLVDGKYGVVVDEIKSSIIQHFTPRNSLNFKFERAYIESPHAWRIRFVNEENEYRQDERIVYDDGFDENSATKFEQIEFPGVTNPDQVWKAGRRRIAEQRLRPESYNFVVDFEHLVCTRGDRVLITHDIISTGLKSGRIKSVATDGGGNATSIVIDEEVPMVGGTDYGISIRTLSNTELTAEVVTIVGDTNTTLTFKTPIPSANIPSAGDLFGFGEHLSETLDALVKSIEPSSELSARLVCVPYAEPVFSAETGTIPTFNPNITTAPGIVAPFVIDIDSDEKVLLKTSQGDLLPRIKLVIGRISATLISRPRSVEVHYKEVDELEFRSVIINRQESLEIFLNDVEEGETYEIKLRYITENGEGPFSSLFQHTVIGTSSLPQDVTDVVTEGPYLRWAFEDIPLDFRGFKVRTSLDPDTPWENAQPAHAGFLDSTELDIGNFQRKNRIFLVKAIDQTGNESLNAGFLIRDSNDEPVANVQRTVDLDQETPSKYPGTITGGTVNDPSSELRADGSTLYLSNDNELYLPTDGDLYLPDSFSQLIYETEVQVITAGDGDSQVKLAISVVGTFKINYKWGQNLAIDTAEWRPFPGFKNVQEDDHIKFQIIADSSGGQTKITNMDIIIDAEDQTESQNDIAIANTGTRLTLQKAYREIQVVSATIQSPVFGDYVKVVDRQVTPGTNNGPLIEVYDSTNTKIAKTVDLYIQGVKV